MEVSLMIIKKSRSGYFICLNSLLPVRGGLVALGYYAVNENAKKTTNNITLLKFN
jgi:hypothetical protein